MSDTEAKDLTPSVGLQPQVLPRKAQTHDYTVRKWGHDFRHGGPRKDGTIQISGWGRGLQEGGYLILPNGTASTRYRLTRLCYHSDPSDMWTGEVEFAPRS